MIQRQTPLGEKTTERLATVDTRGELDSFSLPGRGPGARSWLHQVLRYQLASEATRHARDHLAVLLAAASGVLWVAAEWPSLLAESLVRLALVMWALLLAATLVALGLERRWLRIQRTMLRNIPRAPEEDSK